MTVDYATADGSATARRRLHGHRGHAHLRARGDGEDGRWCRSTTTSPASPRRASTLSLSGATSATIGDGSGVVAIGRQRGDALSLPGIFAPADVVVGEDDGYVDLVVSLSAPGLNTVAVATRPSTAPRRAGNSCNGDYVAPPASSTSPPARRPKSCASSSSTAPPSSPRTFTLDARARRRASISRASGRIYIVDSTTAPPLLSIAVTPAAPSIAAGANQQFTATGTYSGVAVGDRPDVVGDLGVGQRGGGHRQRRRPRARRQRGHEHDLGDARRRQR